MLGEENCTFYYLEHFRVYVRCKNPLVPLKVHCSTLNKVNTIIAPIVYICTSDRYITAWLLIIGCKHYVQGQLRVHKINAICIFYSLVWILACAPLKIPLASDMSDVEISGVKLDFVCILWHFIIAQKSGKVRLVCRLQIFPRSSHAPSDQWPLPILRSWSGHGCSHDLTKSTTRLLIHDWSGGSWLAGCSWSVGWFAVNFEVTSHFQSQGRWIVTYTGYPKITVQYDVL